MNENTNPLNFIPEPGDARSFPGGSVVCTGRKVDYTRGCISGELTFKFYVNPEVWEQMTGERPKLPPSPQPYLPYHEE